MRLGNQTGYFMLRRASLIALVACLFPWMADAQTGDPFSIRVESNLVLVKVIVVNKTATKKLSSHYLRCAKAQQEEFRSLIPSQPYLPGDCSDWMINDLNPASFQVFEDGIEQKVQSASLEPETTMTVRDNLGWHDEWSHTPKGKWSTTDVSGLAEQTLRFYRIGYVPSKLAAGSCHRIEVRVNVPGSKVFAPDRYCYIPHPATDPLLGTDFSNQMEAHLNSEKKAQIPLLVKTNTVYTGAHSSRVDVVMEFPWDHLKHRWADGDMKSTIGLLGVVYDRQGSIIYRFSDSENAGVSEGMHVGAISGIDYEGSDPNYLPSRYETQIDLHPGEYSLRVVLSDGEKFGRADVPLTIDDYDGKQIAVSSIVLLKRFRNASAAAQEAAHVNLAPEYVPLVSQDRQVTPTANPTFSRKELVLAYFEVYEPFLVRQPTINIQARVRIVSSVTGTVKDFNWFDVAEFRRLGTATFAVAKAFPVNDLPKGEYRLEVEASDSAGHSTAWHATTFSLD